MIDRDAAFQTLEAIREFGLLSQPEVAEVRSLFQSCFSFADAVQLADSIHVNIKVDDVSRVPLDVIQAGQASRENEKDGYVKYAFPSGLNLILSAIPISQDDLREAKAEYGRPRPFLDHIGIDLRQETAPVRNVFDAIPYLSGKQGWGYASQGGAGKPVFCCHVQVAAKHWVYPRNRPSGLSIPLEFAYGPLVINEKQSGCDLRPSDPQTVSEGSPNATACCGG